MQCDMTAERKHEQCALASDARATLAHALGHSSGVAVRYTLRAGSACCNKKKQSLKFGVKKKIKLAVMLTFLVRVAQKQQKYAPFFETCLKHEHMSAAQAKQQGPTGP
jgi:hypothetical protein